MYYSSYEKANDAVTDLTKDNRAVIAGGTQGIGAGIALRCALAGASVWVIGRSTERGETIVRRLHEASLESLRRKGIDTSQTSSDAESDKAAVADHAFFQADLSDVQEVKRVVERISNRAGRQGVDWLFETQGGPPTGNAKDTPAGIDSAFAVQCLSRYGLAKGLLQAGSIKRGVCFIAAPGSGGKKPLNLDDIELKSKRSRFGLNIPRSGARDSTVLDAAMQTFAERYPTLTFSHIFPGIVGTNAAHNVGFPFPIPQLFGMVSYVVPSPQQFAQLPFWLHIHPDGQRYLRSGEANLFLPWLSRMSLSANASDKVHREAIIAKLDSYGV